MKTPTDASVRNYTWDFSDRLRQVPAPAARIVFSSFDSKGELTQITDPLGNPTTLTHTQAGLITASKTGVVCLLADRKGEQPEQHLCTFQGALQADAYAGFNQIYKEVSDT